MACGVPDDLYWRSTPVEAGALLDELVELEERREYNAAVRAALVAKEIRNTTRQKRTDKVWRIEDFVRSPKKQTRVVSPKEMRDWLMMLAVTHNASIKTRSKGGA